jgi:hypothetical protein
MWPSLLHLFLKYFEPRNRKFNFRAQNESREIVLYCAALALPLLIIKTHTKPPMIDFAADQ